MAPISAIPTGPPCWHLLFEAPPPREDHIIAFLLTHFVDDLGYKLTKQPLYYRIDDERTVHLSREPLEGLRVGGPFTSAEVLRLLPHNCMVGVDNYHPAVPADDQHPGQLPLPSISSSASTESSRDSPITDGDTTFKKLTPCRLPNEQAPSAHNIFTCILSASVACGTTTRMRNWSNLLENNM
ncbi:hypothetical protein CPB85DRAFT_928326 [Mucidula mucida]|nr:hypothetical protein CPB85DRAFT_928326 [Mucidula mucida]